MKNIILLIPFLFLSLNHVYSQIVIGVEFKGQMGFIDTNGNWFIEPQFEDVDDFYQGYSTIFEGEYEGLIDANGEVIIPPKYDVMGFAEDGMIDILHGDYILYFNLETKEMLPQKYSNGQEFDGGYAAVKNKKGLWGAIDKTGKLILPFTYDEILYFDEGLFKVRNGDRKFFVNIQGEEIERTIPKGPNKRYVTEKEKIQKIKTLQPELDTMYIKILMCRQHHLNIYKTNKDKFGIADTSGRIVLLPIYDEIRYFAEGLAAFKKEDKWGYLNMKGEIVIEAQFEDAKCFAHGLAAVNQKGKYGFINKKGKWIIKPKYDYTTQGFRDVNSSEILFYKCDID